MAESGQAREKKGKIILATVKGDIHDIGKNIVRVLLENYSYDVLDLGKDVAPEQIVREAVKQHVPLVGLSALMTTTVPAMEETIQRLRQEAPWTKIMVGGSDTGIRKNNRCGHILQRRDGICFLCAEDNWLKCITVQTARAVTEML